MDEVTVYINKFPDDVQVRLKALRSLIKEIAPQAAERICMQMPTYDLNGRWFVHFAAFKKHIGLYPQPAGIEAFQERLADYRTSKGTIQFPFNKPLPLDLIRDIVQYRYDQEMAAD